MSEEYYPSTIEYNFKPFSLSYSKWFEKMNNFILEQKNKYHLINNTWWPNFVWTHIHIFNKKYFNKRKELLYFTMEYIVDNIDKLDDKDKYRLLAAHQLRAYHNHKNHNIWRGFLNRHSVNYNYIWHKNRKYQPVL